MRSVTLALVLVLAASACADFTSFTFFEGSGATKVGISIKGLQTSQSTLQQAFGSFNYLINFTDPAGFLCDGAYTYACQSSTEFLTGRADSDVTAVNAVSGETITLVITGGDASICNTIPTAYQARQITIVFLYDDTIPTSTPFVFVNTSEGPQCNYNFLYRTSRHIGAGAKDDPHFVGLQGETYDVMGTPETWFNIVSDTDTQMNAFFHQQSYNKANTTNMQQVAIMVGKTRVFANGTGVYVDNVLLTAGARVVRPGIEATTVAAGYTRISTPAYLIHLKRSQTYLGENVALGEPFYNIDLALNMPDRQPHGLLGQTAHHKHAAGIKITGHQGEGEIEGVWQDYEVSSAYATDFPYNKFVL